MKTSSPSFSEMLFTIPFPCRHFSPARITFQSDESIITGTEAMSGSAAIVFRKFTISERASKRASSIFTSMTRAPSATCLRAMAMASSYFFSWMSRRNFREPATLQRSPTFTKRTSGVTSSSSSPLSHIVSDLATGVRGVLPSTSGTYLAIKASSVPQQPPTMFTNCSSIISAICGAIVSGVSS